MAEVDWGGPAAWELRSAEFGKLTAFVHGDRLIPVMEYFAPLGGADWYRLRDLWLDLPAHPDLFEPIKAFSESGLLLRYAAINWRHPLFASPTAHAVKTAAIWGAQIADVYNMLLREVMESDLGRFGSPFAKVDLDEHLRIGFNPINGWIGNMAPEARKSWPRCDERALVYMVGSTVRELCGALTDPALSEVINRCCNAKPRKRYRTLEQVGEAFQTVGHFSNAVRKKSLVPWSHVEEGIGWLSLGQSERALEHFESAYEHVVYELGGLRRIAQWGRTVARRRLGLPPEVSVLQPVVIELVSDRRLNNVDIDEVGLDVLLSRAKDALRANDASYAMDLAQQVLRRDAANLEALHLLVRALLSNRHYADALVQADRLVLAAADIGAHHYLRGKALLALGRLPEARDVFDLACSLDPMLEEAMLLRREADRAIISGKKQVGSQATTIEVPASLAHLRDVLVGGNMRDAIAALSEPRYTDDPEAQLVLARFLSFDQQLERASAVYDRVAVAPEPHRFAALVGKAGVLLELDQLDSALALYDSLVAERPTDLDASEGRARALEKLGRVGEAAAEFRRFIGLATSGSDLRVRVAQLWLERHVSV